METIVKNHDHIGPRAFQYPADHAAMALWLAPESGVLARIQRTLQEMGAHPARSVVLLPYAQLLPLAQRLWARQSPDGFAPRFETTLNWVNTLGAATWEPHNLTMDPAVDLLTAQSLLGRSGGAEQQDEAALLLQSAYQLAPLAAAAGPTRRDAWAQAARGHAALGLDSAALAWEARLARLAVEWVAASHYATDVLFQDSTWNNLDALVVVQGAVADPLATSLGQQWGEKLRCLPLVAEPALPNDVLTQLPALHRCDDAEDEAQRAAACVIGHIAADRYPVALVSADRALTRRLRALLDGLGVAMRDENGWKLSTSQAGATVMAVLRAAAWNASTDVVLAALKLQTDESHSADALEHALRRDPARDWRQVGKRPWLQQDAALLAQWQQVELWRGRLVGRKTLAAWLDAVQQVLRDMALWDGLLADAAGAEVLSALRLQPLDGGAWARLLDGALWADQRLDLAEFTQWVNATLEGSSFKPDYPAEEQLVILPMSQMLGRPFAAVVMAGCDEVRLNPSPEPPGLWTPAQRLALGLPSRDALEAQLRSVWGHALSSPACDVLWRSSDDTGETLLPSALVQQIELLRPVGEPYALDQRLLRTVETRPVHLPRPAAPALAVSTLSASGYDDVRQCPYRFFAQRMLGLRPAEELDTEVDKRDFGNWLHAVLKRFHTELASTPTHDVHQRNGMLDAAADAETLSMGLPEGEFLPFVAAWPALRNGYLDWLEKHEAQGARFDRGEVDCRQGLGPISLIGRLDRVDALADGGVMVIDYKTEALATTRQRVKAPLEDTQMAFYAALLPNDTLRALYLHVGERDGTVACEQTEIVQARDALLDGLQADMQAIAQGAALPALGEGSACDFCQVRGLCRKDFWVSA
jgi:ATP-dependent helicase/nuclease subunit B